MWEAPLPWFGANGVIILTNVFQHEIKYEMGYLQQKDGAYIWGLLSVGHNGWGF